MKSKLNIYYAIFAILGLMGCINNLFLGYYWFAPFSLASSLFFFDKMQRPRMLSFIP